MSDEVTRQREAFDGLRVLPNLPIGHGRSRALLA